MVTSSRVPYRTRIRGLQDNNRQLDVAGRAHLATYCAAEEISCGNHGGLLLDFRCNEPSEFSKKLRLPIKKTVQLLGECVPTVEFESVSSWSPPSQNDALIYE